MIYKEGVYWNMRSYGAAYKINKWFIRGCIVSLGFIIPVLFPVPLAAWIAKRIKNNMVIRYEI